MNFSQCFDIDEPDVILFSDSQENINNFDFKNTYNPVNEIGPGSEVNLREGHHDTIL